jgi:hypothetical protein
MANGDFECVQVGTLARLAELERLHAPSTCLHPAVNDGPRIPLRWGSAATEVCSRCAMWRQTRVRDDLWQPPEELARCFADDEEARPRGN